MKRLYCVMLVALFFIFGVLSDAYAIVNVRSNPSQIGTKWRGAAGTAKVAVPAERTQRIGSGRNGEITLNNDRALSWVAGASYDIADVLQLYITPIDNAKLLNDGRWVAVAGPFAAQGSGTYRTRWTATVGAFTHPGVKPRHLYTRDAGQFTIPVGIASKVASGGTMMFYAGTAGNDNLDVSDVTGEKTYHMVGRAVRGGIVIDLPVAAPTTQNQILETITQYSYTAAGNRNVSLSTIDAINHQALLFSGSRNISNVGMITIQSTNVFNGTANYAPTFIATDSLVVTMTGNNAFQGIDNILFRGAATFTRGVGAATNEASFTLSNVDLIALAAGAGRNGIDLPLEMYCQVDGTVELVNRVISASASLRLNGTGNGTIPLGVWGDLFRFNQNGTLFRMGRLRTATAQETYMRFSSTALTDTAFDVRYYREDGVSVTAWTRFGTLIPANGSLSVSKADLMALLGIPADQNGFVDFRLHTAVENVVAVCQAKMGETGWVNIPIYYLSGNIWR